MGDCARRDPQERRAFASPGLHMRMEAGSSHGSRVFRPGTPRVFVPWKRSDPKREKGRRSGQGSRRDGWSRMACRRLVGDQRERGGRRGELDRGSRGRRRVNRLDIAAGGRGVDGGPGCGLGSVTAGGGPRVSAGRNRPAMAEAQPGRRVQQRGGQDGDAKGPEQGLHEAVSSMNRRGCGVQPLAIVSARRPESPAVCRAQSTQRLCSHGQPSGFPRAVRWQSGQQPSAARATVASIV